MNDGETREVEPQYEERDGGLFERSREYKDISLNDSTRTQPIDQSNQISQSQARPLRQSMHQFEAPKSAKTLCRERVQRYPSGLAEFSSSCKSPMVLGRGGRYCVGGRNHSQERVEKRASSGCRAPARLTMLSVAALECTSVQTEDLPGLETP